MIEPIFFQSKGAYQYRFLSNFWLSPIRMSVPWEGADIVFPTVEHYYQSMKTDQIKEFEAIAYASTPREAKELGAKVKLRADWESVATGDAGLLLIKDTFMLEALHAKFEQNSDLRAQLLATGNRHLVEYAPWGDTYWGVDAHYVGRNMLGTLLMFLRATMGRELKYA